MLSFSFFAKPCTKNARAPARNNQRTKSTRLPLPTACDALLDHTTAEVRANQSTFGILDRVAQSGIADVTVLGEAHKCLVLEYPHLPSPDLSRRPLEYIIAPSVID